MEPQTLVTDVGVRLLESWAEHLLHKKYAQRFGSKEIRNNKCVLSVSDPTRNHRHLSALEISLGAPKGTRPTAQLVSCGCQTFDRTCLLPVVS